jgi:phenylpropionate dioxygenase-like ring-hydroxylating dioxygenase large terminal subunit
VLENASPALAASWIAVATSDELADGPLRVWALGEAWVVVRLGRDRALAAFADRCPHRLAPVSSGRVVDGVLECGYHGWRFDREGMPVAVPAHGDAMLPRRACLRSVAAVAEHLGLIWIAIEDPLAPLPALSGWNDRSVLTARCDTVRTPVGALQLIDNVMDAAHLPFVHSASVDIADTVEVATEIVREDWLVRSTAAARDHTVTTSGYAGCNASLELRFPATGGVFGIVYACQPETATSTRVFKVIARNDVDAAGMARCVRDEEEDLREDLAILERFTSTSLPTDLTIEVHTRADRLSVAWRRLMSDMQRHPRHGVAREVIAS